MVPTKSRPLAERERLSDKDCEEIFAKLSVLAPRTPEFRRAKAKLAVKFKYKARGFDYLYQRILEARVPEEEIVELKASAGVARGPERLELRLRLIRNYRFVGEEHAEAYLLKLLAS